MAASSTKALGLAAEVLNNYLPCELVAMELGQSLSTILPIPPPLPPLSCR